MTDIPLSDRDISRILDDDVKIISYKDINNYDIPNGLEHLLSPHDKVVILYEYAPNYGHWVTLFRYENGDVEFFDPYGKMKNEDCFPDSELGWQGMKDHSGERPILAQLLLDHMERHGVQIHYNDHPFQKRGEEISTCGRHCAVRLILSRFPIDVYWKIMSGAVRGTGCTIDQLVTKITS